MATTSTPQKQESRAGGRFLVLISSIIALIAVVWAIREYRGLHEPNSRAHDSSVPNHDSYALRRYNIRPDPLETIVWPNDIEEAKQLLAKLHNPGPDARPLLIKNAPVKSWAAFAKWTPEYLTTKFGSKLLTFKEKKSDNAFVYHEQKPLDEAVSSIRKRTHEKKKLLKFSKMNMSNFWSIALDNQNKTNIYFSETISSAPAGDRVEAAELLSDITPSNVLVPLNNHFVNLWLGTPGVVAHTHFDQDVNFAIQILGHKRWILSPPSEAHKIVPFPYLHSSFRQSMLNFTSGSFIDDLTIENPKSIEMIEREVGLDPLGSIEAFEVVAGPGNVLYLPPLWFHRVVTEDTSIAINMWTDRSGGDPLALASKVPIPLEDSWTEKERVQSLRYLFAEISSRLPAYRPAGRPKSRSAVYAFDLLKMQYHFLYREKQSKKAENTKCEFDINSPVLAVLQRKLDSDGNVGRVASELSRAQDSAGIQILFASYIEMVLEAVLPIKKAAWFIETCLPGQI
eukprot:TRINITY_DN8750_c0_g1_i1.p1 TRINITY_DN8750_c0_g1~~TRINITY_DN8750_c0_g1_i1.p1  ORF type:complete len:511 (-),score=67.38 TRINITY_DN8750_c0_g1_i1:2-1534(-)